MREAEAEDDGAAGGNQVLVVEAGFGSGLARIDGMALAAHVRTGELTAGELAAQAQAAIAKVNPALSGVVEVFADAVADPAGNDTNLDGPFAGLPFLMKDLGPTMKGRLQEMGSLLMRGNRAAADTFLTSRMRAAGLNMIGRTTTPELSRKSPLASFISPNPGATGRTPEIQHEPLADSMDDTQFAPYSPLVRE